MRLNEILNGINCKVIGDTDSVTVDDIIYDSRKAAPGLLFVCIKGFKSDGHSYVNEVYQKGVRIFAVMDDVDLPEDAIIIKTDDTRKFLALASANYFGHPADKLNTPRA